MDKEKFKNSPLALRYIGIVRSLLWPFGAWPCLALGERYPVGVRVHKVLSMSIATWTLIGQMIYLPLNKDELSFITFGHCYITFLCDFLTLVKTFLPSFEQYGNVAKTFLNSFHLMHHRQKGENYDKMCASVDKVSYYFTLYMSAMPFLASILFNALPAYTNFRNGVFTGHRLPNTTLEYSVYVAIPGYKNADPVFYWATINHIYCSFLVGTYFCIMDLWLSLMVFQIIGHIKVLQQNLEQWPKPKKQSIEEFSMKNGGRAMVVAEMYDDEENEQIHNKLVDCIKHHREIVSFTDMISNFFGPILAMNYAFHMLSCCVLLLECAQHDIDAKLRFGPLTVNVFGQLIQISVIFEIILTESVKLIDSVYGVPWELMDTSNRRIVCIMLHRVQSPIYVQAMGMATVGVTTMAGILKTTFSYFAFLQTLNE